MPLWLYILTAITGCTALVALRLYYILPIFTHNKARSIIRRKGKGARLPAKKILCVVLGSGGHTAEMTRLLQGVDFDRYNQRLYIVGDTDHLSMDQIGGTLEGSRDPLTEDYIVCRVPRSRAVGQSWWTSVLTAVHCFVCVCRHMYLNTPDVVLCNGPGNCVVVGVVAWVPRVLGIKRIPVVYIESFARVWSLSLSGKIMYLLADRFIVQWPGLVQNYPRAEYIPNLV
ncbi:UDP-N-acetylglucosamine transferase subunit [Kickxella alabastrina]|uniref:UDP-N-acetylglucosamine transferase subunit n=1 Tax=Kickxella alabastrina TaxID=61397 RepID=A0ACC1IDC2_9FUNG|nr:UDP-N-acetylglucosamine transferase subunit [Kickxella alabastrina]